MDSRSGGIIIIMDRPSSAPAHWHTAFSTDMRHAGPLLDRSQSQLRHLLSVTAHFLSLPIRQISTRLVDRSELTNYRNAL